MMREILVFGATGQVGSEVVHSLVDLEVKPRVFARDVGKARALFGDAVAIAPGDFDDADAIERALEDVNGVFLSSPLDPRQVEWQGRIVELATAANPIIVKLSGLATNLDSFVDSGRWHAQTETQIRGSGLSHVFLHPMFFMQNLARTVPEALDSGVLATGTGAAAIAMVDVRDIGEVAARLLTGSADRTGTTLRLTTSEALSYEALAGTLSELSERAIRVRQRSQDELRRMLASTGMPDWHVAILLQFNRAFREGLGSRVTDDVADVLERPPRSVRDYLKEIVRGVRPSPR
jgi:uncharacterized protein YbjT (DUF2867 family)